MSASSATVPDGPAAPGGMPRRAYDLFHRDGRPGGLIWRYRDQGVALSDDGIEWTAGEQPRSAPFAAIVRIRLQTGHIHKAGSFGTCTITFRNGRALVVTSLNSWGTVDGERDEPYMDFLTDLHRRLGPEDKARIAFEAGEGGGKRHFGVFALVLGSAFFVILPLVLLLVTGEIEALFIMFTGFAFVAPLYKVLQRNRPRRYDPDRLDDDLMP